MKRLNPSYDITKYDDLPVEILEEKIKAQVIEAFKMSWGEKFFDCIFGDIVNGSSSEKAAPQLEEKKEISCSNANVQITGDISKNDITEYNYSSSSDSNEFAFDVNLVKSITNSNVPPQ